MTRPSSARPTTTSPRASCRTAGIRHYTYDNTLYGFYGFGSGFALGSSEGVATCFPGSRPFHGAPCVDLNGKSEDSGNSPKISLTYKFDPDHMVYLTYSKGFRPGGVNRNGGGTLPPYLPDYLTNYESGGRPRGSIIGCVSTARFLMRNGRISSFPISARMRSRLSRMRGRRGSLEWKLTSSMCR